MDDESFRPWLVALVLSIGASVALVLFTNLSGGYANVPWFLSMGIGVGATLACLWLIGGRIVGWRWVEQDTRPIEKGLSVDVAVRGYLAALDRPAQLTHTVQPLLHAALADRLRRYHAIDLDTEPDRARAVTPAALFGVATSAQPVWPAQLDGLLDQLDALAPRPGPIPSIPVSSTVPVPRADPEGTS